MLRIIFTSLFNRIYLFRTDTDRFLPNDQTYKVDAMAKYIFDAEKENRNFVLKKEPGKIFKFLM